MPKILFSLFSLLFIQGALGQLVQTDPLQPIDLLINNNFGDDCVDISNISSNNNAALFGQPPSILGFTSTNPNFPFASGFVLSTGDASRVGNTTIGTDLSDGDRTWTGDTDLESNLGIANTLNASVVEFDVISATDLLTFNYLIASEEYQQNFPCNVADGFAILIRPTSGGTFTNMATIPNSGGVPVGINTIHPEIVGQCAAQNDDFFAGLNLGATNFEGRTNVLTAVANVIPETSYRIKMVIADQSDFRFDTAVFVQANSLQSEVDLGPDLIPCENATLDADVGNTSATYKWFFNGNELNGITSSDLFVDVSGTYTVEATIQLANSTCIISDSVDVTINADQLDITIEDQVRCDDNSRDGREQFDLDAIDNSIISSLPAGNYTSGFFSTSNDAQNNINQLSGSFTNTTNPQTLFYRIVDLNTNCEALRPVVFRVTDVLAAIDISTELCDTNQDGVIGVDLSQFDSQVTPFNAGNTIRYYPSLLDAVDETNELFSPFTTPSMASTIIARIERSPNECFSTAEITINVILPPIPNENFAFIDACDSDRDGNANFNLTTVINDLVPSGFTGSISYHPTGPDAFNNTNPIADPTNYPNTIPFIQDVFVRFEDPNTGCFSGAIIRLYTNYLIAETSVEDVGICDDPDNDGFTDFNLDEIAIGFLNDLPNVTIEFYELEADRDNDVNRLDQSIPFRNLTNPQTLYIRIIGPNCTEFAQFDLEVFDHFQVDTIPDLEFCVPDPSVTSILDLSLLTPTLTAIVPAASITYYGSQADADNEVNAISTIPSDTSPLEVFATFTNANACAETRPFGIILTTAPAFNIPSPIEFCDPGGNGTSIVDLTVKEPEITTDPSIVFSYHLTLGEAQLNLNPIPTPTAFTTSDITVFVRTQDATGDCASTIELPVDVSSEPIIPTISTFLSCEDDNDGRDTFLLIEKDNEILNGATGVTVTYYLNSNDASNGFNPIDKEADFNNTTNPQTIFIRVQNDEAPFCPVFGSFDLFVDTAPSYTIPSDVNGCDVDDDEITTIDIQPIIDQVSQGAGANVTVTVHDDFIDAVNNSNALGPTYTNTINPQPLYVRVENDNGCFDIEEFSMGVVERPELNQGVPASIECDVIGDRQDGITAFDLESREFDIAGPRQFVTQLTWHENITDAEAGTNAIPNPDIFAYQNTSNPHTVYLRRTNVNTGCFRIAPLELIVQLPLPLDDDADLVICEPLDGIADLTEIIPALNSGDLSNYQIDFYENLSDAENEINVIIDGEYVFTQPTTSLIATARDLTTGCRSFEEFNLVILERPNILPSGTYDVEVCDDDYDGLFFVDLFDYESNILNGLDPNRYFLEYFLTEDDRANNVNSINELYQAQNGDEIFVIVTDLDLQCESLGQFTITVYLPPVVELEPVYIICNDEPTTVTVSIFPGETVRWSTGETTQSIDIVDPGDYSVVVFSQEGCPSPPRTFRTQRSEAPVIESVVTTNFDRPNSVTINVSGVGDYLYFLDNSEPTRVNTFRNVSTGFHEVGAIDQYGCGQVTEEVLVIDYPRFFTPNADGFNDTWQVDDIDQFESADFYVYDRNGKFLKQFNGASEGWDGFFNGQPLPSSDYWFTLKVTDQGREFEVRGHFSMKR